MCPARVNANLDRGFIIPIGGGEDRVKERQIHRRFVELSGGRDADIVVIPTASRREETGRNYERLFREMGVPSIAVLRWAEMPTTHSKPNMLSNLMISVPFGLALGLGLRALQTVPAVKGRNHVEFVDYYYHETTKWNSTLVNLTPGFTIQVPEHTLQPYAGFFFLLPVYARLKTEGDYQYSSFGGPVGSGTIKTRYRLRHSLGFQTTAGIATQSRKGMSWFAEMSICTQSVLLKKSTITSDIRNGVETIGQYTRYSRETDYVKELVAQSRPATTDEPQQKLSFPIPYSSIGLQGGIRIKL